MSLDTEVNGLSGFDEIIHDLACNDYKCMMAAITPLNPPDTHKGCHYISPFPIAPPLASARCFLVEGVGQCDM